MMRRYLTILMVFVFTLLWSQVPERITDYPVISVLNTNTDVVGLYEKFEAVLDIENVVYQNPYNPDEIDVRATFQSPEGKSWSIFGFYDDYQNCNQWKIRFSPNEIGTWQYTLRVTASNGADTSEVYTFEAVDSEYHGWLRISEKNIRYLIHDDGSSFYGVGPAYPWNVKNGSTGLAQLEASGANLFYYWNGNYDYAGNGGGQYQIESARTGIGYYDQHKCARVDEILDWAEERNLKMMFSLWPHDVLDKNVWGYNGWEKNAFKEICEASEFYSDSLSWVYQKKLYRYIIARWAHSRSMGIWESVCEINGTDGWAYGDRDAALDWTENIHNFFRQNDPYGRPITISQGGGQYWPEGYTRSDICNVHLYETSWDPHYSNDPLRSSLWIYGNIARQFWQDFEKPGMYGEAGSLDNYGNYSAGSSGYIEMYHNALWVTWASGLVAAPVWWEFNGKDVFTSDLIEQMTVFSRVAKHIDYANLSFEPSEAVVEDCDVYAMVGDSIAFGWIRSSEGIEISEQLLVLNGLADAPYSVIWINTWAGDTIQTGIRVSHDSQLVDPIPQLAQNMVDAAFVIEPAESGDDPEQLDLTAFPTTLFSDTGYTSQITCSLLDAQSRICLSANNSVTFSLAGPGTLEGVNPVVPNNGVAGIMYRAGHNSGTARITASATGLIPDSVDIVIQEFLNIDNFEEYVSNADLEEVWQKRYGTDTDIFLDSSIVGEGQKSMRVEYSIGNGSLTYAGVLRDLTGDWDNANSLSFWLMDDGSNRNLQIRLYINDLHYWYYDYILDDLDSTTVSISLNDFKSNYGAAFLDPTLLDQIAFNLYQGIGDWGSGILYFDNIRFLPYHFTGVITENTLQNPQDFHLYPNFPNPFNHETIIQYALPEQSKVNLAIFNIQGQLVEELVDEKQGPGLHKVVWNAEGVGSGIYFFQMETRDLILTRKCILIR